MIAISNILNVPVNYLYTEPDVAIHFSNIGFRKYSTKLSVTEEESVTEKAKEVFELYFELENILNLGVESHYSEYDKPISNPVDASSFDIHSICSASFFFA